MERQRHTPPKTNMTIEKWWLSIVLFVFGGVMEMHGWKTNGFFGKRSWLIRGTRSARSNLMRKVCIVEICQFHLLPRSLTSFSSISSIGPWEIQLFRHTSSEDSSTFSSIRMNKIWANELTAASSVQGLIYVGCVPLTASRNHLGLNFLDPHPWKKSLAITVLGRRPHLNLLKLYAREMIL